MFRTLCRAISGVAVASALVAGLTVGTAGSASASTVDVSKIAKGENLQAGEWIARWVSNNQYLISLDMQSDGNLVEYKINQYGQKTVCWASNTQWSGATHADYQWDGNFVLYTDSGRAVWASNTQWGGGSTVDINWRGIVYVGTTPITGACV